MFGGTANNVGIAIRWLYVGPFERNIRWMWYCCFASDWIDNFAFATQFGWFEMCSLAAVIIGYFICEGERR